MKGSIESYATILTCLLEFSSIEQALSYQDEVDRNKVQLYAQSKGLRGDHLSKDLPSAKRSNLSLGNLGPRGSKAQKHNSNFFPTYQTLDHLENLPADDSIMQDQQSTDRLGKTAGKDGAPLSIDTTNMPGGNQASKGFKVATLSYTASKVTYRHSIIQRA